VLVVKMTNVNMMSFKIQTQVSLIWNLKVNNIQDMRETIPHWHLTRWQSIINVIMRLENSVNG